MLSRRSAWNWHGEVKEQFWSRISAGLGLRSGETANRVLSRSRIYTVRLFRATIPKSKLTSRSFPGAFIALAIVLKADPR